MADVVGIIAAGRLVREGTLQELLASEQVVRVRVPRESVAAAATVLAAFGGATQPADGHQPGDLDAWLVVQAAPERASEMNRALAGAGIFASGLESGSDLEMLFLGLTGGQPAAGSEGTFQGIAEAGR